MNDPHDSGPGADEDAAATPQGLMVPRHLLGRTRKAVTAQVTRQQELCPDVGFDSPLELFAAVLRGAGRSGRMR